MKELRIAPGLDHVEVMDGKYTVVFGVDNLGQQWWFYALRYHEAWLELVATPGSGMILAISHELLAYRNAVGLCCQCHAPLFEKSTWISGTEKMVARRERADGLQHISHDANGYLWCQQCQDEFDRMQPPGEERP